MTYRFPTCALRGSREPFDQDLQILEGQLPHDLRGHAFSIMAVGNSATGAPQHRRPRKPFLNGDGMIYRLSFLDGGIAHLTGRLLDTPSHLADERVSALGRAVPPARRFVDQGITRVSSGYLGSVNQANTAVVPVQLPAGAPRVLATFDAGRPMVVHPHTLRVEAPVGALSDWPLALMPRRPFPQIFSTAHPCWAPEEGSLYTVGYSRGLTNLMRGFLTGPSGLSHPGADPVNPDPPDRATREQTLCSTIHRVMKFGLDTITPPPRDQVQVVRWTPRDDEPGVIHRWRLVDPQGEDLAVQGSLHQLGLTRRWLLISDGPFKLDVDLIFPFADLLGSGRGSRDQRRRRNRRLQLLRRWISHPQPDRTRVWLVDREALRHTPGASATTEPPTVTAHSVTFNGVEGLPCQAVHFLVDDADDEGIRIHIGSSDATDAAEYLLDDDILWNPDDRQVATPIPEGVRGMFVGAFDLGWVGTFRVDPTTATAELEHRCTHAGPSGAHGDPAAALTWAVGLPTAPHAVTSGERPARTGSIYWYTHGFIPELLSRLGEDLYDDAPPSRDGLIGRHVPMEEVAALWRQGGLPAHLLAHDTDTGTLEGWPIPKGWILTSPQWVPRTPSSTPSPEGPSDPSEGYLIAHAFTDDDPHPKQIWVFDTRNLLQGPICRLGHPDLDWPYTLHTCWIDELGTPQPGPRGDGSEHLRRVPRARGLLRQILEDVAERAYR